MRAAAAAAPGHEEVAGDHSAGVAALDALTASRTPAASTRTPDAQRRRQIAEAVWRLASSGGLEEVTLRQVAADAGVSARLVQYYFGTRHELLVGALEILNADAEAAATERIGALGASAGAREVVRAVLLELLPLDDERHARHVVYAVYFVRFLRDPSLRAVARGAEPAVEDLIAGLLDGAPSAGGAPPHDARRAAALLVAAAVGLQAQILLEQVTPQDAVALVDHQLDRILGTVPQGAAGSEPPPARGAGGAGPRPKLVGVARPVPSLLTAALAALAALALALALALTGCSMGGGEDVEPLARADVLAPLRGAPPELAALHRRAGVLVPGGPEALERELARLRGRPVVLNLWAAWCPPCREELPLLQRAAAQRGTRVAFLGVDVDDRRGEARRLLEEVFLPYPSVEDPDRAVLRDLGPAGLPATVYLDRRGEVVFRRQGAYPDAPTLAADLDRYAR